MISNLLIYMSMAMILAMACSNPVFAFSTTPDKPQTASVSFGPEFASGKYGTDSRITTVYAPLIVTWSPTDRLDVGIEVPFIYQSNSMVTTTLYETNSSRTNARTVARRGGPGGIMAYGTAVSNGTAATGTATTGIIGATTTGTGIGTAGAGTGTSTTTTGKGTNLYTSSGGSSDVSGLGDIILRAGYILFFEKSLMPQIRTSILLKTPTASTSDGLGTGELDLGGGFDLSKWIGDLYLAGEVLYNYQGRVSGFGLKNYVSYNATVGYQITKNIRPMLILKGATAPSTYSDYLLEARAGVVWSLSDKISLDMYGSRGISSSSPDYGGGIAVIYSF